MNPKTIIFLMCFILTVSYVSADGADSEGEGQWSQSGSHIYFNSGNVGIGTSQPLQKLHVERRYGDFGPGKASIYGHRSGFSGGTNGGSGWDIDGVDAAIQGYSEWGNQFTTGVAGFNYITDHTESAGVMGANHDGSYRGMLGYRDSNDDYWAGYFEGDSYVSGNLGIGTIPTEKLTVAGTIESTSGGIKFPDGTVQLTAVTRPLCELYRGLIVNDLYPNSLPDICLYSTLPDTGQTGDYTTTFGEDSDYTINPPSYTDNGNGTVTDNITSLMWQQEDDNQTYNWYEASGTYDATYNPGTMDVCGSLTLAGYSNWRLPDVIELMGIVDYGEYGPAIDSVAFPNTNAYEYWSSTRSSYYPTRALSAGFAHGYVSSRPIEMNRMIFFIRCVRGEQKAAHSFTVNGDGTVTDNVTGLMWQQEDDDITRSWEEALTYCENLNIPPSTYTDWRLPNIKELYSIVDNSQVNWVAFPNTNSSPYWSSTTDAFGPVSAWDLELIDVDSDNKVGGSVVRCVRGGQ